MPLTFVDAWISYKSRIMYRGATPPNAAKYFLCLASSSTLTRTSAKIDYIAAELPQINGYARAAITWTTDGSFSNANKRHDMPQNSALFQAATGFTLQFQTYFLLADASASASKPFAVADVNIATDTLTVTAHGLANGDQVSTVANAGSTLPTGLAAGTLYFVVGSTTNTLQLSATIGGSAIDLTAAGSGTFILKYATGSIAAFEVRGTAVTLQPNQSLTYTLDIAEQNVTYAPGV